MTPSSTAAPPAAAVRYLSVVTAVALGFGVVLVVLPGPTEAVFGRLVHGAGGFPAAYSPQALEYVRLAHAVIGASMAGWFALALWLVRTQVARGVPGAWQALTASLVLWFALDTSYSLLSGFWPNAVLNVGFLLAFLPGLVATRPRGPLAVSGARAPRRVRRGGTGGRRRGRARGRAATGSPGR